MTAICRLNADDILSEWTNERAYSTRTLKPSNQPPPLEKIPHLPPGCPVF